MNHKQRAVALALFLCLLRGKICSAKGLDFCGGQSYHTDDKKHLGCSERAAFGVFCLTTVYPTTATGAHGNSGGKSAGKDVFLSGKGRKRLEISGNRYSGFLWDVEAAGSNPVTPTSVTLDPICFGFSVIFYV